MGDTKDIIKYLLGTLPEEETERLDERAFTEPAFAAAISVAENDLVDSYVNGELQESFREKFESHYLASPLRREKVRFARAFQEFGRKKSLDLAQTSLVENNEERRGFWLGIFGSRPLQFGFAALALILAVAGALLLVNNLSLREQVGELANARDAAVDRQNDLQKQIDSERQSATEREQRAANLEVERQRLERETEIARTENKAATEKIPRAQTVNPSVPARVPNIVSFILAPPMRGAGQIPSHSIPSGTDRAVVKLELESDDFSAYQATLHDSKTKRAVWRSGRLRSSKNAAQRFLRLNIPARVLNPQIYSIAVSGLTLKNPPEIIGDYTFRVVQ